MKNFLLSIAIITGFAACNNTPKDDTRDIQLLSDPSAYQNNVGADTSAAVAVQPLPAAEVKTAPQAITITRRIIYTPAKTTTKAPVRQPTVYAPPVATEVPNTVPSPTTSDNGTMQAGNAGGTATEPVATTTEAEKKKGWSAAAKGAVIGAGTGAIGGAIISKKKGLGAIVGGVVGAAGGYIIGKDIDKKNNRLVME